MHMKRQTHGGEENVRVKKRQYKSVTHGRDIHTYGGDMHIKGYTYKGDIRDINTEETLNFDTRLVTIFIPVKL